MRSPIDFRGCGSPIDMATSSGEGSSPMKRKLCFPLTSPGVSDVDAPLLSTFSTVSDLSAGDLVNSKRGSSDCKETSEASFSMHGDLDGKEEKTCTSWMLWLAHLCPLVGWPKRGDDEFPFLEAFCSCCALRGECWDVNFLLNNRRHGLHTRTF